MEKGWEEFLLFFPIMLVTSQQWLKKVLWITLSAQKKLIYNPLSHLKHTYYFLIFTYSYNIYLDYLHLPNEFNLSMFLHSKTFHQSWTPYRFLLTDTIHRWVCKTMERPGTTLVPAMKSHISLEDCTTRILFHWQLL